MTLVLAVNGPETAWLVADRRLSFPGQAPRDDARKVMFLETTDGIAIFSYAGLGCTSSGTEPADWFASVLRGRNLPMEQSLDVVANALKREFPPHVVTLPGAAGPTHSVVVSGFVQGQARLYSIDLAFSADRKQHWFRYTKYVNPRTNAPPRIGLAGSGATYLQGRESWQRGVLRLVRSHDRGQVRAEAVADHLALLNLQVHHGIADKTVGPSCIVVWRYRREGIHQGGGAHASYTGRTRDANTPSVPTIGSGMDINALARISVKHFERLLEAHRAGEADPQLDSEAIKADLARVPHTPDEKLR
jgi:hypothetical protein